MERADITCAGINGSVVLDLGDEAVTLDFHRRIVEGSAAPDPEYYFRLPRPLVEDCIVQHAEDWINRIFLSCRFQARRKGPFNEYVYNFFKCLSMERLQYAEGYYAERAPIEQFFERDGYRIQRRCPHLKADLSRFARIEDGVLTCSMHGWQFELSTGRCLTSDDRRLYAQPIGATAERVRQTTNELADADAGGATVRQGCPSGWYDPTTFPDGSRRLPQPE
jgi:UDP-MurNAc hydroxylase